MKAFKAIFKTEESAFKVVRPAKSEKAFRLQYGGNGEIVKIVDVTNDYEISLHKVRSALQMAKFGEVEQDIIVSLIQSNYDNVIY